MICAPDSFKGSLTALKAAAAMAAGVSRAAPRALVVRIPLADGGEGTVEALVGARGGHTDAVEVQDPFGRPVQATLGLLGDDTVVLEMASASGLTLLTFEERDPFKASTFGTGQLLRAALDRGARQIILGVGGSATVDGGAGALQALGARLLDSAGRPIPPGNTGLADLVHVDIAGIDPRIRQARIRVACDVRNPLLGPQGAAAVFGPQKGARPGDIPALEANLARLAEVLARDLGVEVAGVPGAGAAGGLTAGLLALGARTEPGIDLVMDANQFDRQIADAAVILTGEGRVDGQSAQGKVVSGVLAHARRARIPVVALAGSLRGGELGPLYAAGLTAAFPIADGPLTHQQAFARAAPLLKRAAESAMRLWLAASRAVQ